MKPVSVVVDNGEELLEKCIASLRNQTVEPRVVIAMGPRSDRELCESLADKVYGPFKGIGEGRTYAIVKEKVDYIVSCDADTVYIPEYVEYALQDLKTFTAVKAGVILPHKPSPLGVFESAIHHLIPYEFSICFRRNVFLQYKLHLEDYSWEKADFGYYMFRKGWFPTIDPRMVCYTRFPTRGAKQLSKYLPAAIGALVAATLPLAPAIINELNKVLPKKL